MPTYIVRAHAEGQASVRIEADNEEQAEEIAYKEHLTGLLINGGESTWLVDDVEEVEIVREASNGG